MKQQLDHGWNLSLKRACKREFLEQMNRVVPWADLANLIVLDAPADKRGCPPIAMEVMLRIYFLQRWFGLSDPALVEALHDVPLYYTFAGFGNLNTRLPDENAIQSFRHMLENLDLREQILARVNGLLLDKGLMLREGAVVDAMLICVPRAIGIASGECVSELPQTKDGGPPHSGVKVRMGSDVKSSVDHAHPGTPSSVSGITQINGIFRHNETEVLIDNRDAAALKHQDANDNVINHAFVKPHKRRVLNKSKPLDSDLRGRDGYDRQPRRTHVSQPLTTEAVRLTPREIEVLRWHAEGKTSVQISKILHITIDTVKFHTKNAIEKLGASNKTSAAVRATVLGLLN